MIDLEALREAAEKATEGLRDGVWKTCGTANWIYGHSLKGGDTHIADVRGWGYLTGGGHGALGLSGEEGARIQDQRGRFIAAANPAAILELISELEAARECLSRIERMRVTPDDKINRATLIAAIHLARREVKGGQAPE